MLLIRFIAGLDYSDRALVEDLFLKKNIRVVGKNIAK